MTEAHRHRRFFRKNPSVVILLAGTAPRSNRQTNLNATTASSHDKAGVLFLDRPGRREAAWRHSGVAQLRWQAAPSKNRVPVAKTCEGHQNLARGQFKLEEEMINTMSEIANTLYDEEVPDAALELAGSKLWEGPAASFTLSFCSGLDTCPTSPRE